MIIASLEQPPVATTCTVCVPADRPVKIAEPPFVETVWDEPPSRVTVYGGVPPLTVTVTEPFEPSKQLTGFWLSDTVKPALKES